MNDSPSLVAVVGFLHGIGIPVRAGDLSGDTFLPAVRIVSGTLVYDPARLHWPGDLLHEAGHIAVTPPHQRPALNDALDGAEAAPHGGEVEAIAWSWAAAMHIGLQPEELFHPDGYKGHSAGLLMSYTLGVYPGAHGLAQAGMTVTGPDVEEAAHFPTMRHWLRPPSSVA